MRRPASAPAPPEVRLELAREDLELSPLVPPDALRLWLALHDALVEIPAPCQTSPVPHAWDYDGPTSRDLAPVAVAGCLRCPGRRECLQYALAADEGFAVWGGLTPAERRGLTSRDVAS